MDCGLAIPGSQLPVPAGAGLDDPEPANPEPAHAQPAVPVPAVPVPVGAVPVSAVPAGQLAAVGSGGPAAGLSRPVAAIQLAGMGGDGPETGMELPVPRGQLPGLGYQPPGTDEEPTVTAARPRPPKNAPGPRAAAVAPPRHPGRRRRSRLWAAAGATAGAAGVLVAAEQAR